MVKQTAIPAEERKRELDLDDLSEFVKEKIGLADSQPDSSDELYELREQLEELLTKIDKRLAVMDKQYKVLDLKTDQIIQSQRQQANSELSMGNALWTYEHIFDRCNALARDMYEDCEGARYGRPRHIVTVQTDDLDIRYGYEGMYWTARSRKAKPVSFTHLWRVPEEIKEPLR